MKKALALILVVSTFIFILAACGGDSKLDGKYEADGGAFYEFKNDKDVTRNSGSEGEENETGTYTLADDGKITFTWGADSTTAKDGTFDKAKNTVKVGSTTYNKK